MAINNFIVLENKYGADNYAPLDVVIRKGAGIWVEDVDSNRYLDCLSAYSAVKQGHCHPPASSEFWNIEEFDYKEGCEE